MLNNFSCREKVKLQEKSRGGIGVVKFFLQLKYFLLVLTIHDGFSTAAGRDLREPMDKNHSG